MKEYRFEKLELKSFSRQPREDYREIIREAAKDGWELVQIFAPGSASYGAASYFEIILSRDVD
ncbi:DUF4177 domain-containing protein [Priestia filamentosa]|uniref:DUF4177 domain-containing protein n=1 Tax=Priestia filamentosa TaxID=1402861 RepID=UPI00398209D1